MKSIISFFLIFFLVGLVAQTPCISHIELENQINQSVNPQFVLDEITALKNSSFIMTKAGNTITIPVVFHIIHNENNIGVNENISEQTIHKQLERMNEDFAGINADSASIPNEFKAFFAQSEIQFCLAKIDPQGNFTTGINRYYYPEPAYDKDSINDFIKPATIWNRDHYLNIWSVAFTGFLATNQVNGYATPPLTSTADSIDGIVLNYDKIGNNLASNVGRTAIHEIGHWLGLFHIWGDDNGACNGDDGIADTPNQGGAYFNCPVAANSCGSNDMYINYMDYTDAECSLMFTEDQKTRMHSVLNGFRDSLQYSPACNVKDLVITEIVSPNGTVCQEQILPIVNIKNIGNISISEFDIEMYIDDVLEETMLLDLLLEPNEETYVQFEHSHIFLQNIIHKVKFVINSLEANEYNINNTDSTSFNTVNTGDGLSEIIIAEFEGTSFPPQNIFIENPNNDLTWQYFNLNGKQVFYINNYNNTATNKDAFTTTDFKMNSDFYTTEALSFTYEYRQKNNFTDTLNIYYSIDCGAHWLPIKSYFGNALGANSSSEFIPNTIENSKSIKFEDFLPNLYFDKIRFKFENISGGGNNLYIGNIAFEITDNVSNFSKNGFRVFPNPSTGIINIQSEFEKTYTIRLINALGEKLLTKKNAKQISTKELKSGLYFLHFETEKSTSTLSKKIIVNHK